MRIFENQYWTKCVNLFIVPEKVLRNIVKAVIKVAALIGTLAWDGRRDSQLLQSRGYTGLFVQWAFAFIFSFLYYTFGLWFIKIGVKVIV